MQQDPWLPGFNFNVEERDAEGLQFDAILEKATSGLQRHFRRYAFP